jgi:hypothetical protein
VTNFQPKRDVHGRFDFSQQRSTVSLTDTAAGGAPEPPVSEFVRDGHDEQSALELAIQRVRNSNDVMAADRWRSTHTEDLARTDALGYFSCAPGNAQENAHDAGHHDPSPVEMARFIWGALGDSSFQDETLDEVDRITGAPAQRRAIRAVLADLDAEDQARAQTLEEAHLYTEPEDARWFAAALAAAEQRRTFLLDDLDRLRHLDGLAPLDRSAPIADQ